MERKIGEIFEYNGEWYQVVEGYHCYDCDFRHENGSCIIDANYPESKIGNCNGDYRPDNQNVVFKKLKKVGEPYIEHDHSMNKDIVVQDYKLYNQHACYNGHEKILCFGLFDKDGIVTIKSKEPIKSLNCKNSVEIEIKQNKEDMEDNKLNLKPFDLEAAKSGKPVCTRDGRKARIICFDRDWDMSIVALVSDSLGESVHYYLSNGKVDFYKQNDEDLMMLPEKKEGWININKDAGLFKSKEEAERNCTKDYVPVRVEFEI